MIWGPRLLSPGWLFRMVPLHLAQNKGSDKVWTLCYWFMVRSVYHVMSTMLKFLDPRSYGPILTAKEVGRHNLPVYLWWGMGLETKEPDSALLLGTRYWGLAARWDGWHIIAHSPRLPDSGMSNSYEALAFWHKGKGRSWPWICYCWFLFFQVAQLFDLHLVSSPAISYSQPLPLEHAFFQFWKQNFEYPCLLPPQIPRRPTKLHPEKRILFQGYDFCLK